MDDVANLNDETRFIKMKDKEIGIITLCAVRYSMGRMTYMPSLVVDFIKRNWCEFKDNDRQLFLRDVGEGIDDAEKHGRLLGMDFDHKVWTEFRDWMVNNG